MGRKIIRLLNLVYLAGAAVSVVGVCTQPLVGVNVSATISGKAIGSLLSQDESSSEETPGTKGFYTFREEGKSGFDLSEYLDTEDLENLPNITIPVNIEVPISAAFKLDDPTYLQKQIFDKETGTLHTAIYNSAASVEKDFEDLIVVVGSKVAASMASQTLVEEIEKLDLGITISKEQEEIINQGVEKVVNNILESLTGDSEGITTSKFVDTLLNGNEQGEGGILETIEELNLPGLDKETIEQEITPEVVQDVVEQAMQAIPGLAQENEDGELVINNIDEAISSLLDYLMGNKQEEEKEEEETPQEKAFVKREASEGSQTAKKITELIEGYIPENVWKFDLSLNGLTPYILLGVVVLAAFPWAIFALVTLIRTLRKKKCWTKPWIIFFFAFTELILGAVLTLGLKFAIEPLKTLMFKSIPETSGISITSLLSDFSLGIKTTAFIPSIVYLAMIPFTIVYMIFCHKTKKEYKQEKKDKKAEKKAA